jgi:Ca-activated chloride channel family protein
MGLHGCLEAAKQALLASLDELPSTARFQVIFYNRIAEPLRINGRTDLASASLENKHEVVAFVRNLRAEGSTEHLPALERALHYQPDVIFFLTDADDMKAEQVRLLTLRNQGRSVINAIELSGARGTESDFSLKILANQNRGVYRHVILASGS